MITVHARQRHILGWVGWSRVDGVLGDNWGRCVVGERLARVWVCGEAGIVGRADVDTNAVALVENKGRAPNTHLAQSQGNMKKKPKAKGAWKRSE